MLKAFVDRIVSLAAPNIIESGGHRFSDRELQRVPQDIVCKSALHTHTLTSIVDYLVQHTDSYSTLPVVRKVVHIKSPTEVCVTDELNDDKERNAFLCVEAADSRFRYGNWMDVEQFIISVSAHFASTDELVQLLKVVGNVVNDESVQQADDGVSQRLTVKNGLSIAQNVTVHNPVELAPYRTFAEIEQPVGKFVFRMRKNDSGVQAALFESGDLQWKNIAVERIRIYLQNHLSEEIKNNIIILA